MFFMVATFMHYLAMDLVHFCLRIATSAAISAPGLGVDTGEGPFVQYDLPLYPSISFIFLMVTLH